MNESDQMSDHPPSPSVERVEYSNPKRYLQLQECFGRLEEIANLAASLNDSCRQQTLLSICRWINRNLEHDDKIGFTFRSASDILESKKFGGCAEFAVLFTALSRSCNIPTVFVKTMDIDWIRKFVRTGDGENWRGHVFLEVFWDSKWRLLEPGNAVLYNEYESAMRIFPGNRFAYDKGDDPLELVLSMDWQRWKIQTTSYFKSFDLAILPVGEGKDLSARASFES